MSTDCVPWPVPVEIHDGDTVTETVQIRCGCTFELEKDYGHD